MFSVGWVGLSTPLKPRTAGGQQEARLSRVRSSPWDLRDSVYEHLGCAVPLQDPVVRFPA